MARQKINYTTIKRTNSGGSSSSSGSSGSKSSSGSSGSKSSSGSSGSYSSGDKYAGGSTFVRPDGSRYDVSGSFTSPSGKESYIDSSGNVTTISSGSKSSSGSGSSSDSSGSGSSGSSGSDSAARAYQKMLDAQLEARKSAFNSGKNLLNTQANDASRQAYIQYMQSKKALPEQLSAVGINGGAAESSILGLEGSYGNNLNSIESAKNKGIAELESQYESGAATDTAAAQQYIAQLAEQRRKEALAQQNQLAQLQQSASAAAKPYQPAVQRTAESAGNDTTGNSSVVPTSYMQAQQLAINSKSMSPLAAYYKAKGYTDAQVASMLNQLLLDPEGTFYAYGR